MTLTELRTGQNCELRHRFASACFSPEMWPDAWCRLVVTQKTEWLSCDSANSLSTEESAEKTMNSTYNPYFGLA
jgi:hypothetical protein